MSSVATVVRVPHGLASVLESPLARVGLAQGLYFMTTGLWPLFDMASFLAVTGPKTDLWLVRTVGVLIAVIGAGLVLGAARGPGLEAVTIAIGAALGLATIDVVYVTAGTISPIYLLDAVLELGLVLWWIVAGAREPRGLRAA